LTGAGRTGAHRRRGFGEAEGVVLWLFGPIRAIRSHVEHGQTSAGDPALLKALIAALQAENAQISATLRARIAKLRKQVFGQSSEKIDRTWNAFLENFVSDQAVIERFRSSARR